MCSTMKDYKFSSYGELNTYLYVVYEFSWKDTLAYANAKWEAVRSRRSLGIVLGLWDFNKGYQTSYGHMVRAELTKQFYMQEGNLPKFKEGVDTII